MRITKIICLTGGLLLGLSSWLGAQQDSPAFRDGTWYRTWEFTLPYFQPYDELASSEPDPASGFTGPGAGVILGSAVRKRGSLMDLGLALEFRAQWHSVDHASLESYLEPLYDAQAAFGTDYQLERKNHRIFATMVGPTLLIHGGSAEIEARFLVGRLDPMNPRYVTLEGTYVPPGWERFFLSPDNETPESTRRWNWAYSPEVNLIFPFNEYSGMRLHGSMLFGNLDQEMEIIDLVPQPGGATFVRRQASFSQPVRVWSAGLGLYLRVPTVFFGRGSSSRAF